MSARVILTAAPESENAALGELREAGVQAFGRPGVQAFGRSGVQEVGSQRLNVAVREDQIPRLRRLAPGILLAAWPGTFSELAAAFRTNPPLFIRHVQPVDREVELSGDPSDLMRLEAVALELAPRLDPHQPFSVQTRLTSTLTPRSQSNPPQYGRYDVNERLAATLRNAVGAPLDVRAPEQVLSVLVAPGAGYLGLSRVEENLSAWAGGGIRFAREPDQVSRSEFKLLEALTVFHLSVPAAGAALDLGASPGGWTRLLRKAGLPVTAVDPGDLDPRVACDPGVQHVRASAQELRCWPGEFAVIVNDMRMDARDSARLMLDFVPCLAFDGWAVMILKLPHRSPEQVARQSIKLLRRRYRLLGARQLYHNRSEITIALQRSIEAHEGAEGISRKREPSARKYAKARNPAIGEN